MCVFPLAEPGEQVWVNFHGLSGVFKKKVNTGFNSTSSAALGLLSSR